MKQRLQELYRNRELLYMLTYRDIKVRYKQSIMGFLWAILMPVLIIMSGVVIRYVYALAVKALPWAFLVSSIRFACLSLINNRELVTKIYFPKEIFPISTLLAAFFDFLVASVAVVVFLAVLKVGWSLYLSWVPVLIVTMLLLSAGIGMIVAAASLYFRDVKFIVEIFLTFGIFFTPVFYDTSMLGSKGKWLLLNPMSPILDGFAASIAHHKSPDLNWLAYSAVFAVLAAIGGYTFFKHLEPGFAESI